MRVCEVLCEVLCVWPGTRLWRRAQLASTSEQDNQGAQSAYPRAPLALTTIRLGSRRASNSMGPKRTSDASASTQGIFTQLTNTQTPSQLQNLCVFQNTEAPVRTVMLITTIANNESCTTIATRSANASNVGELTMMCLAQRADRHGGAA